MKFYLQTRALRIAGSGVRQLARGFQAASNGEAGLRVNGLPAIVDLEQPVVGRVVAHWDIAALFEPVRDDPPVFTVAQPRIKIAIRFFDEHVQGHGVGAFKLVEDVGEFRILRRAIRVDDRPEGGRLFAAAPSD